MRPELLPLSPSPQPAARPARDIDEARDYDFPVFARHATARTGSRKAPPACRSSSADITVRSGGYVVADGSTVVFIAQGEIERVLDTADAVVARARNGRRAEGGHTHYRALRDDAEKVKRVFTVPAARFRVRVPSSVPSSCSKFVFRFDRVGVDTSEQREASRPLEPRTGNPEPRTLNRT